MKKCPKCQTVYGDRGGKPALYKFCPMCGGVLEYAKPRRFYFTEAEWEELNNVEYAIPWNTDIKIKGGTDESF